MDGPLVVRSRRPGDFFYPAGMEGRKKLKEFFIDLKLPRVERARVPLLECAGEIAWVMGYRQDRRFIIGPEPKRLIKISFTYNRHSRDGGNRNLTLSRLRRSGMTECRIQ